MLVNVVELVWFDIRIVYLEAIIITMLPSPKKLMEVLTEQNRKSAVYNLREEKSIGLLLFFFFFFRLNKAR